MLPNTIITDHFIMIIIIIINIKIIKVSWQKCMGSNVPYN